MKKVIWWILVVTLALTGCSTAALFETLGNIQIPDSIPAQATYTLELPENAAVATIQGDAGTLYFCDGYEILVETMPAGNLDQTVRSLSGFGVEDLTVMETKWQGYSSFECVWTSAGDGGFQTARSKILDDGRWHYCLTVLAPSESVSQLQEAWNDLFTSFGLTQS